MPVSYIRVGLGNILNRVRADVEQLQRWNMEDLPTNKVLSSDVMLLRSVAKCSLYTSDYIRK